MRLIIVQLAMCVWGKLGFFFSTPFFEAGMKHTADPLFLFLYIYFFEHFLVFCLEFFKLLLSVKWNGKNRCQLYRFKQEPPNFCLHALKHISPILLFLKKFILCLSSVMESRLMICYVQSFSIFMNTSICIISISVKSWS